ncbi:hypothetical protein QFZ67_000353 [Streptomyces sp. V1I1]|nr:hypothetical protein [Streptomyces sp. V1I1]
MSIDAGQVDRCAGEEMLKIGLRQPPVAGSAQAAVVDPVGDGSFDPSPDLVAFLPLVGLLERAGLLKFAMSLLRPQRDGSPFVPEIGGTVLHDGTRPTVTCAEQRADDRQAML